MNHSRRTLLKTLAGGCAALGALVVIPATALAAWTEAAFRAKSKDEAMQALLGSVDAEASDKITLKAPEIAENGAVVPISVKADLADAESISIFVHENPVPLSASFDLSPEAVADVSIRLRMGKTSAVTAVVKAGGKLYSASKEVKVTIGGCGG